MKKKALKNIPKPDEDKLAIFYGQAEEKKAESPQQMSTVVKMPTENKTSTVDKMSTVVDEETLRISLRSLITHSQQLIYLALYKRACKQGQEVTNWTGYNELSKELQVSLKTVQRAIERLIEVKLIERINVSNTAEIKGSKYRIFRIDHIAMSTEDKMSTVDKNT